MSDLQQVRVVGTVALYQHRARVRDRDIPADRAQPDESTLPSRHQGDEFRPEGQLESLDHGAGLGVALDLLIAAFIFGIFFFHISTTFDSLDVEQMARLKEED